MSKYELLYILDRDLLEEKREELIAKFKAMVEAKSGEIISLDKWGIKRLAYTINFKNEGYYVLMTFTVADTTLIDEMSKLMNITEGFVRHMFIRLDK